ncbi:MAG: hypothetical protein MUF25_11545, partial [Pirellulaceae bacterium]|nr:hypothetical protein [Pirellulaceae bacterium]
MIRLPRLVTEPEPGEGCYPAEDEAEIRATIPLQGRVPDPAPSLPVPNEVRTTTDSNAFSKPTGADFLRQTLAPRTATWLSFRFPRWVIRAGIAAGLIAVFVLAFSAIRGPSENSDKVAESDAADTMLVPGIPALETSPVPLAMPSVPSTAPTPPMAVAAEAKAPTPGAPTKGDPGIANQAEELTAGIPASPAVPQPEVNQNAPAPGAPQPPLPP